MPMGVLLQVQQLSLKSAPVVLCFAPAICQGLSSLITTSVAGSSPFTFAWSPVTDLDDATIQNPTARQQQQQYILYGD